MKKLSLQFHAMPDEFAELLADLFNDPAIFITTATGSPLKFIRHKGRDSIKVDKTTCSLTFTVREPVVSGSGIDAFRTANPDALILMVGQVHDSGLSESWMSAMSENEKAMSRWRQAAARIKAATLTGAFAVNPNNGATGPMRGHRFTTGAQKAYLNGIRLLPPAGNSVIRLPVSNPIVS